MNSRKVKHNAEFFIKYITFKSCDNYHFIFIASVTNNKTEGTAVRTQYMISSTFPKLVIVRIIYNRSILMQFSLVSHLAIMLLTTICSTLYRKQIYNMPKLYVLQILICLKAKPISSFRGRTSLYYFSLYLILLYFRVVRI